MNDTRQALARALNADMIVAVAPIALLTRPVGIAWAPLVPARRPLIETRWFAAERRGVLAPQIARLERLAHGAARDAELAIRVETTDERRAYEELAPLLAVSPSFGDDLARRRSDLARNALSLGIPLHLDAALDLQDAAALLLDAGLIDAPGASLATLNSLSSHPVGRENFDSAVGRLAASIRVWRSQIAPAAIRLLQNTSMVASAAE